MDGVPGIGQSANYTLKTPAELKAQPTRPNLQPEGIEQDLQLDTSAVTLPQVQLPEDEVDAAIERLQAADVLAEANQVQVPTAEVQAAKRVVKGAVTEQLDALENELNTLQTRVEEQIADLGTMNPEALKHTLQDFARGTVGQLDEIRDLQNQLNTVLDKAAARGEEALAKVQERIAPQQERLEALLQQVQGLEQELQDLTEAFPGQLDFRNLRAQVQLQHSLGEVQAEISRDGASAQATLSTDLLEAYVRASSQTGAEGQLQIQGDAFKAVIEASSQSGVEGQIEVNTEALQLLVSASDGEFNAEVQAQVDALKLALEAGPDEVSGRISVDSENFQMVLENTTSRYDFSNNTRLDVAVQAEDFELALSAATDEGLAAEVSVSTESFELVAKAVYRETISAQLGIASEDLNINLGTNGENITWSVGAENELLNVQLEGALENSRPQMSGALEMSDTGIHISIGHHDYGVDVDPAMLEQVRNQGGDVVDMSGTGMMLTVPW